MNNAQTRRIGIRVAAMVILAAIAGCATKQRPVKSYTFFPPPPDEPRIQYLTSFSSEQTLGGGRRFEDFILGTGDSEQTITKPYGITAQGNELFVCDTGPALLEIIDLSKSRIRRFNPGGEGALRMPINVAVDAAGNRYVTDTVRGQVLLYSARGEYLGAIGRKDEMKPAGVFVAGDRLYVTDLKNHAVRVYDRSSRSLLLSIPRDPRDEKAQLFSPTNLAVDRQGRIYVSDTGGFFIKVYDGDGNFLRKMGDPGLEAGRFALPKGIAVDHEGRVYVVDAATQVVQLFDSEGRILMFFGNPGDEGATYLPAGVTVDYANLGRFQKYAAPGFQLEYLIFVTNQYGSHKVNVYGFGHKS